MSKFNQERFDEDKESHNKNHSGNSDLNSDKDTEIAALKKHIKEISESYQVEKGELKEAIAQLELKLSKQNQRYEAEMTELRDQFLKLQEMMSKKDAELFNYESKVKVLEQEKMSYEQRSKDLEKYIETTVKEQMKAYEIQIKALQKSPLEKNGGTLELKEQKKEIPKETLPATPSTKKESFGEDYEANLKKAVVQLNTKWKNLIGFKASEGGLIITKASSEITDENMSELSTDLVQILGQNSLLNLWRLQVDFSSCKELTDKAIEGLTAIFSQLLDLQHLGLSFENCKQLSDKALEHLAAAFSSQSSQFQGPSLKFLQDLSLNFSGVPEITDAGVEGLVPIFDRYCSHAQRLEFNLLGCQKVTAEKTNFLKKCFPTIRMTFTL